MNLFFELIIFINVVFYAESIGEARIEIRIDLASKEPSTS